MECPKCKGRMVYDPPRFEGEQASAKCLICGARIWGPAKVTMPKIPSQVGGKRGMSGEERAELNRAATRLRMQRLRQQEARL